jgi:protein arginine N-methyltransferase 5
MRFAGSDLVLDSSKWTTCVVGKLSPWLDLDSPNEHVRLASEKAFKEEVAWASHLGVPAVLAPTPSSESACANYAMLINQTVQSGSLVHFWIRIPLAAPASTALTSQGDDHESSGSSSAQTASAAASDPWRIWNRLRLLCEQHPHVSVALEVTPDLPADFTATLASTPSASSSMADSPKPTGSYGVGGLARWLGEPIKAAILPTGVFLTNRAGYPTLSAAHQVMFSSL